MVNAASAFSRLHPLLRHHIVNSLGWTSLRPLQERSVCAILDGYHSLVIAPTAGGKTEAASFPVLSQLLNREQRGFSVLYICPLRALLNNLFERLSSYCSMVGLKAGLWHGDVPAHHRRRLLDHPPDVLLTTPESLEAMLISRRGLARERLSGVRTVIVDEIHAFARDDRGTHMIAVLERIQALAGTPLQRIGLSATVGNPDELLSWLVNDSAGERCVVQGDPAAVNSDVQLDFVGTLANAATVISRLHQGEKRLVFCDSRRRVEELGVELRALGVETFLSHSSLSREQRHEAERAFAESRNCVIAATSTLELGIDVGDLDRVIQIDSPSTVASFLQRLGRTGRRPGSARNCLFLATSQRAFLQAGGLLRLWESGYVEPIQSPPLPVHLMAQQLIALVLQEGRIARNTCFQRLDAVASFREVDAETRKALLAHLLENGFFHEEAGFLSMGDTSQQEFGRRNFLELVSAFCSPPVFTVWQGTREIGSIDQNLLWNMQGSDQRLIRLAGKDWEIASIDWKTQSLHVTPATQQGKPLWLGQGAALSFHLCQSVRQLLTESAEPSWLSRRGRDALATARSEYDFLHRQSSGMINTDRGLEWHTFAGGHCNLAISQAISRKFGFSAQSDDFAICVEKTGRITQAELTELRTSIPAATLAAQVDPPPKWLDQLKFSACLPESIGEQVFRARLHLDGLESIWHPE